MLGSLMLAAAAFGIGPSSLTQARVAETRALDMLEDDLDRHPSGTETGAGGSAPKNEEGAPKGTHQTKHDKACVKRRALRKRGNSSRNYNRQRARLLRDAAKKRRKTRANRKARIDIGVKLLTAP